MTDGDRFPVQVGCLALGTTIGIAWTLFLAWVNGGRLW
jgi:hypothetical protein